MSGYAGSDRLGDHWSVLPLYLDLRSFTVGDCGVLGRTSKYSWRGRSKFGDWGEGHVDPVELLSVLQTLFPCDGSPRRID